MCIFVNIITNYLNFLYLNADNWNVSKIQNVPLEDLAFKVNAWMLVLLLEYVVPMPFVQF